MRILKIVFQISVFFLFVSMSSIVEAKFEINELGRVPVLEYHRIEDAKDQFARSAKQFRDDLLWLYHNDYYLIPVSSFVDQNFHVPSGKKPFMLTFDDSHPTQFSYQNDGRIDPDSAIGILNQFMLDHRDFGFGEMFFVNPRFFDQPQYRQQKLSYLLKTGREVGNHTKSHANVRDLSPAEIMEELGFLQEFINQTFGRDLPLRFFAYPFGGVSKGEEALSALAHGRYEKVSYTIDAAFLVGADPTHPSYHENYEALYIPRIQAIDEEWKRWFGRLPGQTEFTDSETFYPFVSDGDASVVTVVSKSAHLVDQDKLRVGLTVCVRDQQQCVYTPKGEYGSPVPPQNFIAALVDSSAPSKDALSNKPPSNSENIKSQKEEMALPQQERGGFENLSSDQSGMEGLFLTHVQGAFHHFFRTFASVSPKGFMIRLLQGIGFPHLRFGFNEMPPEIVDRKYVMREGDTLASVAEKFVHLTPYEKALDYQKVLFDDRGTDTEPGTTIFLPDVMLWYIDLIPQVKNTQGIYLTGYVAGSSKGPALADKLKQSGGNSIVFDVKEVEGKVYYSSNVPLAQETGALSLRISDVSKLVRDFHRRGLYTIARLTLFKDENLANSRKDFTIKNVSNGMPWQNREGLMWVDPSHPEVVAYNLDLLREVVGFGVDEVQFDYVRFPALGGDSDTAVRYWFQDHPSILKTREDVIVDFLRQAREVVVSKDVALGADVFGIVAWSDGIDAKVIGQDINRMAQYVDAIYPMVYPSHFGPGYAGHSDPANEEYFFVQKSTEKFLKLVQGTKAEVRPWIQGFSLRVNNFGPAYMQSQVKALRDIEIYDFVIWNAANNYDVSWGVF